MLFDPAHFFHVQINVTVQFVNFASSSVDGLNFH